MFKSTRFLWFSFLFSSLLATALFLFGFVYAVKQILFPSAPVLGSDPVQRETETILAGEQIRIVALGDSLTRGTGDQTGKGYVGHLRDLLQQKLDKPVFVQNNFSVNGYRTDQLLNDLRARSEVLRSVSQADIVTLTIGGNDFFNPGEEEFRPEVAERKIPEVLNRLEEIFRLLSSSNGDGRIFYAALYYPFGDMDSLKDGEGVLHRWNYEVTKMAAKYENITVVPTFDLFEGRLNELLYSDHYHPNEEGYRRIAERMTELLF